MTAASEATSANADGDLVRNERERHSEFREKWRVQVRKRVVTAVRRATRPHGLGCLEIAPVEVGGEPIRADRCEQRCEQNRGDGYEHTGEERPATPEGSMRRRDHVASTASTPRRVVGRTRSTATRMVAASAGMKV